ncbi:MAG: protoporphyrinogen oxidase HemJ [Candidatus Pacebacteria bacterium]|nr:protoporphyrinogen oxidase HemJ [Candidatus Paceibacterota bacterium]
MVNFYLSIKTLHLLAVISWMAGLLYLPRLFVYHSDSQVTPSQHLVFKTMERRLYYFIASPAMVVTLLSGAILLMLPNSPLLNGDYWIVVKLVFVSVLVIYHLILNRYRQALAEQKNRHSPKYFRILNEVPTVLLLFILVLVVFKPW